MLTPTRIAVYLLAINFLTDNMGTFSEHLNNFIASILLVSFTLMYCPTDIKSNTILDNIWRIFLLFIAIILFKLGNDKKLIAAALLVYALSDFLPGENEKKPEFYILFTATLLYFIFIFLYQNYQFFWQIIQKICGGISILLTTLLSHKVEFGATYVGIGMTISFLIFSLTFFYFSNNRRLFVLLLAIFFLISANILYLVLLTILFANIGYFQQFLSYDILFNSRIILFLLLFFPTYVLLSKVTPRYHLLNMGPKRIPGILLAVTAVSFLTLYSSPLPAPKTSPKIVFFDESFLDWDVPVFGRYGGRQGGMFGMLLEYLRGSNYEVAVSGLKPEALHEADTLVFINLNRTLMEAEKALVWNFVRNGGSLLVLGDHTGDEQIRIPYNDLLAPMNISFNFDSAISLTPKWANSFDVKPHFISNGLDKENDLQIWIGASLSISHPARPVIIGKHAFSDQGNIQEKTRGYLGDMKFFQGEKLGDVILVAETSYGDGKVLVFGDTSSFQNTALALSSRFVAQVFQWLCMQEKNVYPYIKVLLTIMLLLAAISLVTEKKHKRVIINSLFTLSVLISLALILIYPVSRPMKSIMMKNTAYIDISHLERVNLDLWGVPEGFGGLLHNLMRNGYFPQVLKTFDAGIILNADVLIIIAPADPFTNQEVEIIGKFVRSGGFLIMTVGWEEKDASLDILQFFGLGIGNTPLGRVLPSQNNKGLSFHKAWPVVYDKQEGEILCELWKYPLAIYHPHGNGGVLLVGDSSFLLNRNLEGLHNYSEANIMLLKEVISTRFRVSGARP